MNWRRSTAAWFVHLSATWKVRTALAVGLGGSNAIGILVVLGLLFWVVPMTSEDRDALLAWRNLGLSFGYFVVATSVGTRHAWRVLHPVVVMLHPGATTTEEDQRDVLAAPRRIFLVQASLWAVASVALLLVNVFVSADLAVAMLLSLGLAGWATSCLTYLLAERALRPVARQVLRGGVPNRRFVRSVASRAMFAWAFGTGVPAMGVIAVGVIALTDPTTTVGQLAVTMVVLGGLTLVVGFLSSYVAAQASSEPIRTLREALQQVARGDLDVHVPIYDGTEIGLLQAGFNETVEGLRERESLRDLFGRHVGADVAKAALEGGIRLGGEVREVSVLFADVIGSTTIAENRPPDAVVTLLNNFFRIVIDVVHEHGGFINKFEGDAALAVWGAPVDTDNIATCSLTAARVLGRRLAEEMPQLRASVGLSGGRAVAGNVGTPERYEYTVIGDPVNEAARLTTHAKDCPSLVLANHLLVHAAGEDEARHWVEVEPIRVRGRSEPTRVATPRPVGD